VEVTRKCGSWLATGDYLHELRNDVTSIGLRSWWVIGADHAQSTWAWLLQNEWQVPGNAEFSLR